MNNAAFIVPGEIIHRTVPWLVIVAIMFTLNRLPGTINSGVAPGRASPRPCWHVERTPVSSPQGISPPSFAARLSIAGYVCSSHSATALGVLLVGFPHRLLRRVAPAPQILAHGADRQPDAELLMDQVPNG